MSLAAWRDALAEAVALLKCNHFPDTNAKHAIARCEALLASKTLIPHPSHQLIGSVVCRNCCLDDGDEAIGEPCHPLEEDP